MMINKILSYIIYFIVRVWNSTLRYHFDQNEMIQKLGNRNYVFAIWHQSLFTGILAQTGKAHIVIISKSKDAEPVAFLCNKLGHISVRGSSKKTGAPDKGGKLAKDEMIEFLKKGYPGAITVDGPKGPALVVKAGIIDMAQKAGAVIVPYTLASSSYFEFNSWDRFRIPKPFAKILVSYGEAIDLSDESISFEDYRLQVENSLLKETKLVSEKILNWKDYSDKNWFEF